MCFKERLEEAVRVVEESLSALLDERAQNVPDRLLSAMRYGLLGGGKRIRPFLLLSAASMFTVPLSWIIRVAAAVECVHCYSLIHDDLPVMDASLSRRGQPCLHIAFDESTAILAGDALLTLAFEVLADEARRIEPQICVELIARLARAAGAAAMVGGQMLDMEARIVSPDIRGMDRLNDMKTGALLCFAVEAGGLLGRATTAEQEALRAYGKALGSAFQIADDLRDVQNFPGEAGKERTDIKPCEMTCVTFLGVEPARCRLADFADEAIMCLTPFGPRGEPLRELVHFVVARGNES